MVIDDKDAWQIAHAANIVIFTKGRPSRVCSQM